MTSTNHDSQAYRGGESTKCILLFSGGLDSTTLVAIARHEGLEPLALVFRYGQRHGVEVDRAVAAAERLAMEYRLVDLDLGSLGGSALTSRDIAVPKHRSEADLENTTIPPTYVPARNTLFLSYALAWAEVLEIADIYIGVNAIDYSGYPDCRPQFIDAFETLANLATRASTELGVRVRIRAPLIQKSKAEIIRWGKDLGVDYSRTWSCYAPVLQEAAEPVACGGCDSCLLRRRGFHEAGIPDPTVYDPSSSRYDSGDGT